MASVAVLCCSVGVAGLCCLVRLHVAVYRRAGSGEGAMPAPDGGDRADRFRDPGLLSTQLHRPHRPSMPRPPIAVGPEWGPNPGGGCTLARV